MFAQIRNIIVLGYLPDPFLHSKLDSFTDWYNPAYWAHNPGAYDVWRSIYPPLCFVVLWLFSNSSCYNFSVYGARDCDPVGIIFCSVLTVVNFFLALAIFWKVDRRTAVPRAIALGLGFPSLYAWERGNLIIPCFTAYLLAHGNILKSGWLKAMCAAVTLNFKPYLILAVTGRIIKRDWIWLEWCALFFVAIYAASYAFFGAGDPLILLRNTSGFEHTADPDLLGFTSSYTAILMIVKLPLPYIAYLGSNPIEFAERIIPILIYAGAVGVGLCLAYVTFRPHVCTRGRASALLLLLFMSMSTAPGGYSVQFALLFVFFERWSGPGRALALICGYLWCVTADVAALPIFHDYGYSFLGRRMANYDLTLTWGMLARPGLLLLMEYGLVASTAYEILLDARAVRRARLAALV